MASVGQIIQQKRKELGLSIEDVQVKTKISAKHIIAIENDDFEKIPGEAYARGFLRLYADSLGIDSSALVAQYKREAEGIEEEEATLAEKTEPLERDLVKKPRSKWWILAAVAAVALLVLGYLGLLGRGTPRSEPPKPIVAPEKEEQKEPEKEEKPSPPAPAPAPSGVNLTLSVVDTDCWMEVKTDDQLVYSGTMKVGETKSWRAEKSIYLFAASGRRIKAIFNNQDLGFLNETGEPIKKTFTTQGIQEGEAQL